MKYRFAIVDIGFGNEMGWNNSDDIDFVQLMDQAIQIDNSIRVDRYKYQNGMKLIRYTADYPGFMVLEIEAENKDMARLLAYEECFFQNWTAEDTFSTIEEVK